MKRYSVTWVMILLIVLTIPIFSAQKGFGGTIGDITYLLKANALMITMIVNGKQVSPSPILYLDNEASKAAAQLINLALINQTVVAIKFEDKDARGRENAIWLVMATH